MNAGKVPATLPFSRRTGQSATQGIPAPAPSGLPLSDLTTEELSELVWDSWMAESGDGGCPECGGELEMSPYGTINPCATCGWEIG